MAPCNKPSWWGGSTSANNSTAAGSSGSATATTYESSSSSSAAVLRIAVPVVLSLLFVTLAAIVVIYLCKRYRSAAKAPPKAISSVERDIEMNKEPHVSDEQTDVDSDSVVKDEK
jgi:hypothetical protein